MSRDATRRHHDDTSMHGPIRYTFYQRAHREQEGPKSSSLRFPGRRKGRRFLDPQKGVASSAMESSATYHVIMANGRAAANGEKKIDLPEAVARFGDILNTERPIVEIGPRSVFANSAVGSRQ